MAAVRIAALLLLGAVVPAMAGMYKIVGPDGKVSYSDDPPAAGNGKVTEFKVQSYSGPAVLGTAAVKPDWEAILRRPIAESAAALSGLVMFSTPTCGYCKKAKQYMGAQGIAYAEIDINQDQKGLAEYRRLGGLGVPFFVYGDKTMTGFSEAKLSALLGRSP